MLRSVKEIYNYTLRAKDGDIGRCLDFLFDDRRWALRYMVADTGRWLPKQKVLISPIALGEPEWSSQRFRVDLRKGQIEDAPPLDSDAPVSREYEKSWLDHYGWPPYWVGSAVWGRVAAPQALAAAPEPVEQNVEVSGDVHLRSTDEVEGYHIQAVDGEIGHVEDFIMDDENWKIQYVVVDTKNWLPGRKVLIAPPWVTSIDWGRQKMFVGLTREEVKNSPRYDERQPVNREYESRLYDYYGRPAYWVS